MPRIPKAARELVLEESAGRLLKRSDERQTELGEVFTPTELVLDILTKLPPDIWRPEKTFFDPACGNGQFLAAVATIKLFFGHKNGCAVPTDFLDTIYGIDIMKDNVEECRERLLKIAGRTKRNKEIVEKNIICGDGLEYGKSQTKLF
jgi:SAM-dependent methyltransferase